ncbi:hypothetical protein X759_36275 [Mesorhizobium sp. LSHC420B00]|nr:hypothetical protein X759_36275 [Mesorhizobium sp. LSHC420B00]
MEGTVRIIGMDIHRVTAEVVSLLDGEIVKLGRVQMLRNKLEEFARKELTHDDHVVIEATGNAAAVAEVLSPYVHRIVIANPKQVHMIAHAKVKTDTIDALSLRSSTPRAFCRRSGFRIRGPLPSEDRSPGGHSWFASVRG